MIFFIQASSPEFNPDVVEESEGLREAIEDSFPMFTESAFLNWNGVSIPLCYKYDFSVIIDDLMRMLQAVLASESGSYTVLWASNTFNAEWTLEWDRERMRCVPSWYMISGGIEALLSRTGHTVLPTRRFLGEWKRPLDIILSAVTKVCVQAASIEGIAALANLTGRLPDESALYGDADDLK